MLVAGLFAFAVGLLALWSVLDRIASAHERIAHTQELQTALMGLAAGIVSLSEVVGVRVPDAPPEDL
jgi:CHASE3 domain sensor protein